MNYNNWLLKQLRYGKWSPRVLVGTFLDFCIKKSYRIVRLGGVTKKDFIALGSRMFSLLQRYFPEKFRKDATVYWFPEIPDLRRALITVGSKMSKLNQRRFFYGYVNDRRLSWVLTWDGRKDTYHVETFKECFVRDD
jgi:hypothetical protein